MNRRHENAKTARGKLLFKAKPPTAKPKGTENLNNSEASSQHRLPGTIFGDEYRLAGEMGRGKGFTSSGIVTQASPLGKQNLPRGCLADNSIFEICEENRHR